MTTPTTEQQTPKHTNRLIHESSPYLLKHAHNPVDWYTWGPEAFAKAKAEDRPIFLSVGYAACHWCSVMERESFENEATAALLNANFVCIKVDREERPDVDALYMDAVQALTGSGGWPMTVFLLPDGAPFYGGTYFPPAPRYGMPGFPQLLENITRLYHEQRSDVEEQAQAFREFYRKQGQAQLTNSLDVAATEAEVDPATLTQAANGELASVDRAYGGFGGAPKFPHPLGLAFLLRMETRRRSGGAGGAPYAALDPDLLDLVALTLDKMAAGGIYDQIGGGFHRYATDAIWLTPHFEKMLYDNALLAPVYLHAWQLTGNARYREVCEEILDYVLREMTDASGAFYSTQDADSEGEEGKFSIWSPKELRAALGDEQSAVVERLWGVSARGNFEGRNILHLARTEAEVASETGHTEGEVHEIVQSARATLYRVRGQRVWPGLDDKAITSWNALMLRAFAEAAELLDRNDYRHAATANADFLIEQMRDENGRLLRTWRLGNSKGAAYLEDYAALVNGLLSLYALTGEPRYFRVARERADELLARFWDENAQSFYDTASDAEQLIGRPRELTDNATPSGSSLAAEALLRLAAYTGEARYREYAARVLVPLTPLMAKHPSGFGQFLCALDDLLGPLYEVALVGATDDSGTQALRAALRSRYLPRMVFAQAAPDDSAAQATVPLLAERPLVGGQAALYVCQGFVCQQPVTTPDEALALLPA